MHPQQDDELKQQAMHLLQSTLLQDNFFNITNEVSKNGESFILADSATMNILVGVKTRQSTSESATAISDEDKLGILAHAFHLNRVAYAAVVVWHASNEQPTEIEWYKLN